MNKIILFSGQGSQFQGMGAELFEEFPEIVHTANTIMGCNVSDICLHNPDNLLNQTNFTQPALYLVNALYYKKYLQKNKVPDYLLGHSLGEFNALHAAGVFNFETGLRIVKKRGELMFTIKNSSMAAVIGGDADVVTEILKNNFPEIDIANINTPTQIVISGLIETLEKAADYIEGEGYGYVPLKVSGAFHSRYMTPVKESFQKFIEDLNIGSGSIPVISNYKALPYEKDKKSIINNMVNQINSPVKWLQSIEFILSKGEVDFIELGPGEILSNMIKKIKIVL